MPALAETETQHPDVRFLFVNQGEGAETAGRFLEAEGLALEHVLFDQAMAVPRHDGGGLRPPLGRLLCSQRLAVIRGRCDSSTEEGRH